MELWVQLLTCLDLKTTSWSLFLMVRCALLHGRQLHIESIRIRTFPSLTSDQLILGAPRRPSQEDRGAFGSEIRA